MSGRGKGKTTGKKSVSRSTKAGLQVCAAPWCSLNIFEVIPVNQQRGVYGQASLPKEAF